jgi:hypothetical protein
MTEDYLREVAEPLHAFKLQQCRKQHISASMAFDGSEGKDIFKLRGA